MECRDEFITYFEWKHVHSLHSLGAQNRPMSITIILTNQGSFKAELPPPPPPPPGMLPSLNIVAEDEKFVKIGKCLEN